MTTQTDTLRKALQVARQYVELQNRAEGIFEGFGGRKPRPSDADLQMVEEAIALCQQAQEPQPAEQNVFAAAGIPDTPTTRFMLAEAEQQAPHDGPPITAWVSINRVSGGKTLAFHKVTSGHDATLYSHIELREQAPAITEQAPPANVDQIALETATAILPMFFESIPGAHLKAKIQEAVSEAIMRARSEQAPAVKESLTTEQAPPLPEMTLFGASRYGTLFKGFTADQLRERDAMWMAKIAALRSEQAPTGEVPSEDSAFWQWITKEAEEGRDHYVFSAKAGFNAGRALSTPPAVHSGWKRVPMEYTDDQLAAGIAQLTAVRCALGDAASDESICGTIYDGMLSAAPAAPDKEQPK